MITLSQTIRSVVLAATLAPLMTLPVRAQATPAAQALKAPAQGSWPTTTMRQGRYFAYPAPAGWQLNETTNGVDVTMADLSEGVNFIGLEGSQGSSTPRQWIERIMGMAQARNLIFTETHTRPTQNGFETAEFLYTYTDARGHACQGWAWSAVNNSFGRNNTYGEIAWATTAIWARDAQFLVATARLVNVTNPQQAFQRDQLLRNRVAAGPGSAGGFNHPNTFTPYSNQAAMDRISDVGARARRDDTPLIDPSTGRTYHGTSETYDYVKGGWVNPVDPTQLLKVVPPGGHE